MPVDPHPITVTVQDNAGSALSGAKVFVRNCTKKTESPEATSNGSGQAIIDLADLPLADGQTNEYDDGDVILIIAHTGQSQHAAARYVVTGDSKSQTIRMNYVGWHGGTENNRSDTVRLRSILVSNTDGSNPYHAKVYAVGDGELLAHIECLANSSQPVYFGPVGIGCARGFVVVPENAALIITADAR